MNEKIKAKIKRLKEERDDLDYDIEILERSLARKSKVKWLQGG